MNKEAFYDDKIAPVLLELVKQCEAEGLSLVAMCEFAPNETGTTCSVRKGAGIEIVMANMAMRSLGNVDLLLMSLCHYGDKHGHNSVMLGRLT